jgi:hypothetical protein
VFGTLHVQGEAALFIDIKQDDVTIQAKSSLLCTHHREFAERTKGSLACAGVRL